MRSRALASTSVSIPPGDVIVAITPLLSALGTATTLLLLASGYTRIAYVIGATTAIGVGVTSFAKLYADASERAEARARERQRVAYA